MQAELTDNHAAIFTLHAHLTVLAQVTFAGLLSAFYCSEGLFWLFILWGIETIIAERYVAVLAQTRDFTSFVLVALFFGTLVSHLVY